MAQTHPFESVPLVMFLRSIRFASKLNETRVAIRPTISTEVVCIDEWLDVALPILRITRSYASRTHACVCGCDVKNMLLEYTTMVVDGYLLDIFINVWQ